MSLIQDALKRQQQETGQSAPADTKPPVQQPTNTPISLRKNAGSSVSPMTPPPLPSDAEQTNPEQAGEIPQEESSGSNKKRLGIIIGAVVLIIVLAGGGIWAFLQFRKPKSPSQPPTPAQVTQQPSIPSSPAPIPVTNEAPKQPSTVTSTTPDTPTVPQTQTVSTTESPMPNPTETVKTPEPSTPPVVAPPPTEEAPVTWPALVLTGVVGKGVNGSAIINKQIVGVGESIEGVKVVTIRDKSIEIEFKGKTQVLKIGGSTQ